MCYSFTYFSLPVGYFVIVVCGFVGRRSDRCALREMSGQKSAGHNSHPFTVVPVDSTALCTHTRKCTTGTVSAYRIAGHGEIPSNDPVSCRPSRLPSPQKVELVILTVTVRILIKGQVDESNKNASQAAADQRMYALYL